MKYNRLCIFLVVFLALPPHGIASLVSEQGLNDIRQTRHLDHEVIYEDKLIRVLTKKQCEYQDKKFYYQGTDEILWIELQKNKDRVRKTSTIIVYHKNKKLDEPIVESSSSFKPSKYPSQLKYVLDKYAQKFEPTDEVFNTAISTYVPLVAAKCNQAELILARQEFHQIEPLSDRIVNQKTGIVTYLPFNTFLGFERDGNDWILNDSYTTRDVENHTVRSVIGNPRYAKYYASIKQPDYSYFDGVFLREKEGSEKLTGIAYKPSSFWHGNFELFSDVFEKVFVGNFYGAILDEYYYLGFTELIEANSRQCGDLLKGDVTEITIEYYTLVTDQFGSYEKDKSVQRIRLKSKYVDSYQTARKENKSAIISGFNVDMSELMKRVNNLQQYRKEAESFIDLSNCESTTTNQLIDNYFRSLNDLPSLQDDRVNN
jgi:hypothetical protein